MNILNRDCRSIVIKYLYELIHSEKTDKITNDLKNNFNEINSIRKYSYYNNVLIVDTNDLNFFNNLILLLNQKGYNDLYNYYISVYYFQSLNN